MRDHPLATPDETYSPLPTCFRGRVQFLARHEDALEAAKAWRPAHQMATQERTTDMRRNEPFRWRIVVAGLLFAMATTIWFVDGVKPARSPKHLRLTIQIPPISDGPSAGRVFALAKKGGPEAYQAFFQLLKRPDAPSQRTGIMGLTQMGALKPEAVPFLIPMLKDDWCGLAAARALGSIGPEARTTVPDLIMMLDNQFWLNRQEAAAALGNIGSDAKSALPTLRKAMEDPMPGVRFAASVSAWRIDARNKKEVLRLLIDSVKNDRGKLYNPAIYFAIQSLGEMGPEAKESVPVLMSIYQSRPHFLTRDLVKALRKIDPEMQEWKVH